jgi:hypothetical protein
MSKLVRNSLLHLYVLQFVHSSFLILPKPLLNTIDLRKKLSNLIES